MPFFNYQPHESNEFTIYWFQLDMSIQTLINKKHYGFSVVVEQICIFNFPCVANVRSDSFEMRSMTTNFASNIYYGYIQFEFSSELYCH